MRNISRPAHAFLIVLSCVLSMTALQLVASARHRAEAATSITPTTGPGSLGTTVNQNGNVYGITNGRTVGSNLFHSFAQFSVATGDTAQFQTNSLTPNSAMQNILARVTGQNPSSIFGTVDSATYFPNASLFLVNPAGIVFGPNASLNVGGAGATFTTADYIKLQDGVKFTAVPNVATDALLSAAPVSAFGFLSANPMAIAVQGSSLSVQTGQAISLVGGNQGFSYTDPDTGLTASVPGGVTMVGGTLSAPGGQINIASVASPGEISAVDFMPTAGMAMGAVNLSQGATLDVSGDTGGTVRIHGGQFVMDQAFIYAGTFGDADGASTSVNINVTGDAQIKNASAISVDGFGAGRTGNIEIQANNLSLTEGSFIANQGLGNAPAGNIDLTIGNSLTLAGTDQFGNGSLIQTVNAEGGTGGMVNISAANVSMSDTGKIVTEAGGGSPAGNITMQVGNLSLAGGASIQTEGRDTASSGNIHITATGNVSLQGQQGDLRTRILNENTGPGGTGSVTIETGSLTVSNKAQILSQTFSIPGNPPPTSPKVSITATDSVSVSGGSRIDLRNSQSSVGSLDIAAKNITLSDQGLMNSNTEGAGNAGAINIAAQQNLSLTGGSQITSQTRGLNTSGNGGIVSIMAGNAVSLSGNGTAIQTGTAFTSAGNAGLIQMSTGSLTVSDGALLASTSATGATGNAGRVNVSANQITVQNTGSIQTSTGGPGAGGNILLNANQVALQSGGTLSAKSSGAGKAGNVTVAGLNGQTPSVQITGNGSGLFTDASGSGAGGNISITAGSFSLNNGGKLSATTSGNAASAIGGTITVNANQFQINNGAVITAASSGAGNAGNITIRASGDFQSSGGSISTTAAKAQGGDILITAGQDIRLTNGASISASSTGPGNAGAITALAGDDFVMQNSSMTTQAAQASGGNIKIGAQDQIVLQNSLISASVQGGSGSGGNISIDPTVVVLQNSQILAQAVLGNGGNITITTPLFFADQTSVISASSQFGVNGTVTIQSPTSNLAGTVASLPSSMRQAQSLQTGRCAALANSQSSSFVVAGRETVPAEPGGWLPSPFASLNAGERLGAQDNGEGLEVSGHGQRMRDEDVSGLSRASDQRRATNHMLDRADSIDQGDQVVLSLRRLTPAGFLTQSFAESGSTGCRS
jgi:filamentous hemagglutinin family protein